MANAVSVVTTLERDGVWAQILAAVQARADAAGLIGWTVSVDSTISRAHQHATGARRDGPGQQEPPGGVQAEPEDHGLGRSRGGWTTKAHLACEQGRKLMVVVVTAGQRGDSPQFIPVLAKVRVARAGGGRARTRPDTVLADKPYTSKAADTVFLGPDTYRMEMADDAWAAARCQERAAP